MSVTLVHMRARDYDPVTASFIPADPLERAVGSPSVDTYDHTDGNFVQFWDPSVLRGKGDTCEVFGAFTLPAWASGAGATDTRPSIGPEALGRRWHSDASSTTPRSSTLRRTPRQPEPVPLLPAVSHKGDRSRRTAATSLSPTQSRP